MNAPEASWGRGTAWVAVALAALVGCPAGSEDGGGSSGGACDPGEMQGCPCNDGTMASQTCRSDGLGYGACLCPITGGMAEGSMMWTKPPVATPPAAGATGTAGAPVVTAGAGGAAGIGGAAGAMIGSGGIGGVAGMMLPAGTGGAAGATSGGSGGSGSGGSGPITPDDKNALRQQCVDHINMYRATLSKPPLARATPAQEACSDMGAQKDADSGQAHGSAGDCDGLGGQNTCPGWGVGGFSGNATLAEAMTGCLDQMWDEGPPPKPDNECIADYQGCFLLHGHWMNMSNDMYSVVSCGFYEMPDGKWWMNQDFGS